MTPRKGVGGDKVEKKTPTGKKADKDKTPGDGKKGPAKKDDAADVPPAVERYPPCRPCLKRALHGRSDGTCMQKPNKRRYERCSCGGECSVIPPKTKDVCLFFLAYHHKHPTVNDEDSDAETSQTDIAKEKRNRRIAAKTVLKGYDAGGRKQDLDLK
ncbi:uncharacterized protein FPRN_12487 [Fusarium proliferatum]|uniref:Uncharacterized protein n=1 Tax=Gibberella intermedia TaxID=948311 RepID=A0A420SHH6_GIBIN|nr:hypothetical protein BFJ72_g12337 [Fusarium proliferatum]CVK96534.1 uncharacterized protein FPRN_12487 [Fusarium proliferatum]